MAYSWNPWRGCIKYSDGCTNCYIHRGDAKRGVNTNYIVKSYKFEYPLLKDKKNEYKIKSGSLVYICFSSDFLLPQADKWRDEVWKIINERKDVNFLFLTKRIERFLDCIPNDWNDGYDNVIIGCTVENQIVADIRLPLFKKYPIKHRLFICQPLLSKIDLRPYLDNCIESVTVGGESGSDARVCDYNWILDIRDQCIEKNVTFEFRETGSYLLKDNKIFKINTFLQHKQAREANINFYSIR